MWLNRKVDIYALTMPSTSMFIYLHTVVCVMLTCDTLNVENDQ